MKLNKNLNIFILCHLIIWSLLPILLRPNLPMDSAEALVWGFAGEWGTNKHPPLSGFLADLIYSVCSHPASVYVLSQILIAGAFVYIYRLARLFLPENKSLIATLVLEGVAYYSLVTPEYNVNIIALLLWPAATFHFYKATRHNCLTDWLLFGVFAGLNILTKYVSGILFLCLGLYIIFTPKGREQLKSWKLYLAVLVGVLVIAPHIYWLHRHDYYVLSYFAERSSGGKTLPFGLAHLIYPFKFIGAQVLTSLFALIILFTAYFKSPKEHITTSKEDRDFIFFAGVMPLLVMTAISLVFGIKLKSMWGSPVMYMLGICFFVFLPFDDKKSFRPMLKACWAALFLFAFAFAAQTMLTTSAKFKLNAKDFVAEIGGNNVQYVGGSVWLASIVGSYGLNNPSVLFFMSPETNPWIDMKDVKSKGILVVDENLNSYNNYRNQYPKLPKAKTYVLKVKNMLGKEKEHNLYYGFITGE